MLVILIDWVSSGWSNISNIWLSVMRHEVHGHGARGKCSPDLPLHSADEYVKVLLPFAECSNMSPSQITLLPSGYKEN